MGRQRSGIIEDHRGPPFTNTLGIRRSVAESPAMIPAETQ
jgi:hypothetical protein